jgi:hypothetical protein
MLKELGDMHYIKKVLFAIIIGFAVVSFWRGAWGIMDNYIFHNNYALSSWVSLGIGIVVLMATHYTIKELT